MSDFCLGGVAIDHSLNEIEGRNRLGQRKLGGYDYTYPPVDIYLAADGKTVSALQSYVQDLCTFRTHFGSEAKATVTQTDVLAALHQPYRKTSDSLGEYWFYSDQTKRKFLVFYFIGNTADKVQVVEAETARRQWFPLLGEVDGPKPLIHADAGLASIEVGMDANNAETILGSQSDEGELRPYRKLLYPEMGVELHVSGKVAAIYAYKNSTASTPRGIRVGSATADLVSAYGSGRVVTSSEGQELRSYENLSQGVGLVFWLIDGRVSRIGIFDSQYEFRPSAN